MNTSLHRTVRSIALAGSTVMGASLLGACAGPGASAPLPGVAHLAASPVQGLDDCSWPVPPTSRLERGADGKVRIAGPRESPQFHCRVWALDKDPIDPNSRSAPVATRLPGDGQRPIEVWPQGAAGRTVR